jgi:hypothetical protein
MGALTGSKGKETNPVSYRRGVVVVVVAAKAVALLGVGLSRLFIVGSLVHHSEPCRNRGLDDSKKYEEAKQDYATPVSSGAPKF